MFALALLLAAAPAVRGPATIPGPPPLPLRPAAPNAPPPPDLRLESVPDPAGFYPKAERKAGVSGTTKVQLIVRYDGRVSRCQVVNGSGWAALDAAACRLAAGMRFAHFVFRGEDMAVRAPSTEFGCCASVEVAWADGSARVRRTDVERGARLVNRALIFSDIDYPAAALRAGEQGRVTAEVAIAADGRPTGCTVLVSSGSATLDAETCRLVLARGRAEPAVGPDGAPVPGTDRVWMRWTLAPDAPPPAATPQAAPHL